MNGIKFLLDTNVILGILKQSMASREIAERFGIDTAGKAVSQISRMEMLSFPALTAEDEAVVREFLAECSVICVDDTVEMEAIALRRSSRLKLPDAIIAATALVHDLHLVTLDMRLMKVFEARRRDLVEHRKSEGGQPNEF